MALMSFGLTCLFLTVLFVRNRLFVKGSLVERIISFLVLVALFLSGFLLMRNLLESPIHLWNAIRLAWFLSPVYGYNLYYTMNSGPALAIVYGPVGSLFYLPAVLAGSINGKIIAGSIIHAICFFSPLLWLYVGRIRLASRNLWFSVYAFACFCLFALRSPILNYTSCMVHVDGPAIGFAVLACLFIIHRKQKDSIHCRQKSL